MNTAQRFHHGDVVYIAADLGATMSHFPADTYAIVMYSYNDHYGSGSSDHRHVYSVLFLDDGDEVAWYNESQLTFLRRAREGEIEEIHARRRRQSAQHRDLGWIVTNWAQLRESAPGNTGAELMRLLNVPDPSAANGEGFLFVTTALAVIDALDPVMSTGDLDKVKEFIRTHRLP